MKVAILGLGQVGRALLQILSDYSSTDRFKSIQIVLAADFQHMIINEDGMDPKRLLYYKQKGDIWGTGYREIDRKDLFGTDFDVLVDLMPATKDGVRARDLYLESFRNGRNVVAACKSGLANFWDEIMKGAKLKSRRILYEATVAGGVPLFNFIKHCHRTAEISYVRGQVNSAANFVLLSIASGKTFDEAINDAKKFGILEADFHFDTLGIDSAWKTVIIANSVFGTNLKPSDVKYDGVEDLSKIQNNLADYRLLSSVKRINGKIDAESVLVKLNPDDPVINLKGRGLGFTIGLKDRSPMTLLESSDGPIETAGAVLNDLLELSDLPVSASKV